MKMRYLSTVICVFVLLDSKAKAQCPDPELTGNAKFSIKSLSETRFCSELLVEHCLFIHEAKELCSCACNVLITGEAPPSNNRNSERAIASPSPSPTTQRARTLDDGKGAGPGTGTCYEMARCLSDLATKIRDAKIIDEHLKTMEAQKTCPVWEFNDLAARYRTLYLLKAERIDRLAQCIQRKNNFFEGFDPIAGCYMPSREKMDEACFASRVAKRAQANRAQTRQYPANSLGITDSLLMEDDESLMAFVQTQRCIGNDICDCPETHYCFNCYQRELTPAVGLYIHGTERDLILLRLKCGFTDRKWMPTCQ